MWIYGVLCFCHWFVRLRCDIRKTDSVLIFLTSTSEFKLYVYFAYCSHVLLFLLPIFKKGSESKKIVVIAIAYYCYRGIFKCTVPSKTTQRRAEEYITAVIVRELASQI